MGNGVPVFMGLSIKGSLIDTHLEDPILLLHHHYERSKRTGTRPDMAQRKKLLNGLVYLVLIGFGVPVGSSDNCLYTWLQRNGVLKPSI